MVRLLIFGPSLDDAAAELAAFGEAVEPVVLGLDGCLTLRGEVVTPEAAGLDAAWASGAIYFSPAATAFMTAMLKSPSLKWVQSAAAGFDHPVFGRLVEKGVRLTTSHGQAVGIADYVMAGVLDHFQRGPERRAAQAEGAWRRRTSRDVAGTAWLIVGFGAIGQGVAARARAFGATITGIRRDQSPHPLADAIAALADVKSLAPKADVVVLSAPLNDQTRRLADDGFFGAMKSGSVFINVGRGGLVDEPALLAALDRGTPEHAVLDVFETEPLPADSRFWDHPRVALSPHDSGASSGNAARNQAVFIDNLRRFLTQNPLLHEADPKAVLGR